MPPFPPLDGVLVGQVGSWFRGKRDDGKEAKLETSKTPIAVGRPSIFGKVAYIGIP